MFGIYTTFPFVLFHTLSEMSADDKKINTSAFDSTLDIYSVEPVMSGCWADVSHVLAWRAILVTNIEVLQCR